MWKGKRAGGGTGEHEESRTGRLTNAWNGGSAGARTCGWAEGWVSGAQTHERAGKNMIG